MGGHWGHRMKALQTIAISLLSVASFAAPALAQGSVKDAPADARKFSFSVNIGGTSDYVFRGISQSDAKPAVQGGVDLTYGILYAGLWSSNVDFGPTLQGDKLAKAELDLYAGIKPVWGPLNFDFGVIYYTYPGANDGALSGFNEQNYVELKAGVSGSPFTNFTIGGTVFFSPEYQNESGRTWTLEGTASYELPKIGPVVPSISGTLGTTIFENSGKAAVYNVLLTDDHYLYWNAGLGLAIDKIALDFRYWDSDISGCTGVVTQQCDQRFVFSAKITLP